MNIDKKRELTERILTSFILFFIIIFSILAHSYFLVAALIIISVDPLFRYRQHVGIDSNAVLQMCIYDENN